MAGRASGPVTGEVVVNITSLLSELDRLATHQVYGKVAAVQGLLVEVSGVQNNLSGGARSRCRADDPSSVSQKARHRRRCCFWNRVYFLFSRRSSCMDS